MSQFDDQSIKRIADAVRGWEGHNRNPQPTQRTHGSYINSELTVKIKSRSSEKYGWVAVKKDDSGNWIEFEEWGEASHTDNNYAMEAEFKSTHVLLDEIVVLRPVPGRDYFVFFYNPSGKPAAIPSLSLAPSTTQASSGTGTVYRTMNSSGSYTGANSRTIYYYGINNPIESGMGTVKWCGGVWMVDSMDCYSEV